MQGRTRRVEAHGPALEPSEGSKDRELSRIRVHDVNGIHSDRDLLGEFNRLATFAN